MLTGIDRRRHGRSALRFRHRMRPVAPLSPLTSLNCAYLPSPRGCRVPQLFSPLVYPERAFAKGHSSLATSPLFSFTCRLFIPLCALFPAAILYFQQFADSFAKTPGGVGGSSLAFKRPDAPSASSRRESTTPGAGDVSTGRPDRPSDLTGGYDQGREM